MKRILFAIMLLHVALSMTACVTEHLDESGNPIEENQLSDELVMDDDGRLIGRPTRCIPTDRLIINGDTPTEREIRLLGVEGVPESEAPNTYAECQEWMAKFLAPAQEVFVKPALDTNLNDRVIYGIVYIQASDPDTGKLIKDGYVIVNMALLDRGLVRIRDAREIQDERLREAMIERERVAKREKRGLWGKNP